LEGKDRKRDREIFRLSIVTVSEMDGFCPPAPSAVAGFGGRRFLVLQHEEAAIDCRGAG